MYTTRDQAVAAALECAGYDLNNTYIEDGMVVFVYEDSVHIREIVERYIDGTLQVNARKYAACINMIKKRTASMMNNRNL